jgi:PAS domain S-box-containing protein
LDGQLVEANPAFLQLLGVQTLAEAQALNLHELFLHPQVKSFDRTSLSPAAASAPVKQWLGREIQLRQAHGETVWVTLNQTITAVDRELFVEGLTEDISDRKALELALQQQAEALAHANRLKDEFLTTIYHELRTPLNTILGWAKILRAQPIPSVAMFNRALEVIERNAIKQANIIEDILDVSQIIQGQLRLNPTSVNLEKTLAAAIEGIRPAAEAKSITLNLHLASDLNFIWGDANRLQQILWNLLLNAVKFTPRAGQIEVRVELLKGEREKGKGEREKGKGKRRKAKGKRGMEKRLCRSHSPIHPSTHPPIPSYAQITITDTGIGISPEFLPYVFDRFSQADGSISRNYGGLGMGLAIVRHLVELHGGTVSAESPGMGQGATFTVRIPSISPQIPSTTLSAPD